MRKLLIMLIKGYRLIASPWLGNHCRFTPTCSEYALMAIERHGALKGAWLAICRLGSCHPWHAGGHDPVPEQTSHKHQSAKHTHG